MKILWHWKLIVGTIKLLEGSLAQFWPVQLVLSQFLDMLQKLGQSRDHSH